MKNGFTLIELTLVVGVLGILATVVIIAVDPLSQLNKAFNAREQSQGQALAVAIKRYEVSIGPIPQNIPIPRGSDQFGAIPICAQEALDKSNCYDADFLMGDYLTELPEKRIKPQDNWSGYKIRQPEQGSIPAEIESPNYPTEWLGSAYSGPPTITPLDPADNQVNFNKNSNLTFVIEPYVLAGNGKIYLYRYSDNVLIQQFTPAGWWVQDYGGWDGEEVFLNPDSPLAPNTQYYVLVDATAFHNLAHNVVGIYNKDVWNFTTGP